MARSSKVVVGICPDGERGLFAGEAIAQEEIILTYDGPLLDHPTRLSIQVDHNLHIEGTDDSNSFLNHSCDPKAYVDWQALCLRARVPIPPGVEITVNYLTTDDRIHSPFTCRCGSQACKGRIRGFSFLPAEEQRALARWLPQFLKSRL
jgi:hypothetical protein